MVKALRLKVVRVYLSGEGNVAEGVGFSVKVE